MRVRPIGQQFCFSTHHKKTKEIFHLDSICPSALLRMALKERTNMFDRQIEMSFENAKRFSPRRQRRHTRAQWWFQRMRQIVDLATEWPPAPSPRPVQIWFPASENRLRAKVPATTKRQAGFVGELCE
jgi:hypothetical protein